MRYIIATCNEYSRTCSIGASLNWGNDKNREGLRTLVSFGEVVARFHSAYRASEEGCALGDGSLRGWPRRNKGKGNGTRGFCCHNQLF